MELQGFEELARLGGSELVDRQPNSPDLPLILFARQVTTRGSGRLSANTRGAQTPDLVANPTLPARDRAVAPTGGLDFTTVRTSGHFHKETKMAQPERNSGSVNQI